MSREARTRKAYEAHVVADSLARLAKRIDLKALPFSDVELRTLARRAREAFHAYGSEAKKERSGRYKAHLSTLYGEAVVEPVWTALVNINNEIGYEEK